MAYIVNIGLEISKAFNVDWNWDPAKVEEGLRAHGFRVMSTSTHQSDTEGTLIALIAGSPDGSEWEEIAHGLLKDCIAVFDLNTMEGQLYWPQAGPWGPFNPDYFLTLDGSRLSDAINQADAIAA